MPRPARVVKWLLIINVVAFVAQIFSKGWTTEWFAARLSDWPQVWRYLTFQFLHDAHNFWHIALNMLGLYMLGTPLEQRWGGRRFLRFYLSCGAAAGIAYVVMQAAVGPRVIPDWFPLVGASGGVYAILLAAAVFFPHYRLILFLFPVPIRFAAVLIFGFMILTVLMGISDGSFPPGFWSDVAHLGGAVAAAVWVWLLPKLRGMMSEAGQNAQQGAWERKLQRQNRRQEQIDDILDKIAREGIASLTEREKQALQDATRRQREEDQRIEKL
jgi:membrane associated rhomboid family serine protease